MRELILEVNVAVVHIELVLYDPLHAVIVPYNYELTIIPYELRRVHSDLILTYKILFGLTIV